MSPEEKSSLEKQYGAKILPPRKPALGEIYMNGARIGVIKDFKVDGPGP